MKKSDEEVKEDLLRLRKEIIEKCYIDQWKEVWFYEEDDGVKGFLGTQDIIFLGLNPSSGKFPSRHDKIFYKELKNNEFENAHITDLIKIRAPKEEVKKLKEDERTEQTEFLIREIENIVDTKLIVVMGKEGWEEINKIYDIEYIGEKTEKNLSLMESHDYKFNKCHGKLFKAKVKNKEPKKSIKIIPIYHYTQRSKKNNGCFVEDMKGVKEEYDKLESIKGGGLEWKK